MPSYHNLGSMTVDLYAFFPQGTMQVTLLPGKRVSVSAGIKIKIPEGFEGQIRPVTWIAEAHGVTVLNSPVSIDSNHTGVVRVILINHGDEPYVINYCSIIAELGLVKLSKIAWINVADDRENREIERISVITHTDNI
jgi:dUTP pyrophosphatase